MLDRIQNVVNILGSWFRASFSIYIYTRNVQQDVIICVVPVAVNCSYCTPDDGYGKYPKHVE
jgi:hypothetical protein